MWYLFNKVNTLRPTFSWSVLHRPEIVSAGRYPVTDKSRGHIHRSVDTVALHHHDYEGGLRIGPHEYALRPGDLTLTPADTESLYDLARDGFHLCIHFRHMDVCIKEENHALSLPLHLRLGAGSDAIRQRIHWITDLHRRAAHADPRRRALALAAASAGLQELLLTLALSGLEEPLPEANSTRVEAAVRALVEIVENRLREPLSVPDLAEEAGLSQNYLAQAFRHRYGLTMPNFILRRRIELACYLLTASRATVSQIAHEVGLPDVQHFNKQFRRLEGVSPTAYRERHRKKSTAGASK